MATRREFLASSLAFAFFPCAEVEAKFATLYVNDIHSQLNRTRVDRILQPTSTSELQAAVRSARAARKAISIAGGRHAMRGQQFGTDTIFIDTRFMNRILHFDQERGTIEVEAGIQWPQLITQYLEMQKGKPQQWGIAQKQTGANRLCIGGSLSANAHGRGLTRKPLVADVESLVLVDGDGKLQRCSRSENADLFRLVNGGYGLFGPIASVTVRLIPRRKLQRVVEIRTTDDLIPMFNRRIVDGFLYGDFQFSIDQRSDDFLKRGVFSCYRPVPAETPEPEKTKSSPTKAGAHFSPSPIPTRARPSKPMRITISPPMDSCTGQILTSSASTPRTIIDLSTERLTHLTRPPKSLPKLTCHENG